MNRRVLVVGDVVTDVLAILHDAVAPGSDTRASIRVTGGGQAANTAAWLASLRVPVTLVAAVGEDQAGRAQIAELTTAGVDCAVRHCPQAPTGTVVVLADDSERSMISDRGANKLLLPDDVDRALAAVPDAVHLHLSGYTLLDEESRPAGLHALRAAREHGMTRSVDASSARPLRQVGAAAFLSWVRGIELLLANEEEAAVLIGGGLPRSTRSTVVKLGPGGAEWSDGDAGTVSVPADAATAVDSTGAEPAEALRAGARLGAIAVSNPGGRPG